MNYKTYAEAKIANPDCEIVTTGKNWGGGKDLIGTFEAVITGSIGRHIIDNESWIICNPADYCSSLKNFFDAGFRLASGDKIIGVDKSVWDIAEHSEFNHPNEKDEEDENRYILSAAALNGGCKIPAKAEQWTVYNNTMPLCELSDEQAAPIIDAWRTASNQLDCFDGNEWFTLGSDHHIIKHGIYRIKPKSERELFIENTTKLMRDAGTKCPDNHEYFGIIFDAVARYKDLTQHFGENI